MPAVKLLTVVLRKVRIVTYAGKSNIKTQAIFSIVSQQYDLIFFTSNSTQNRDARGSSTDVAVRRVDVIACAWKTQLMAQQR